METAAEANVLRASRRAWRGFALVVALAGAAVLFLLLRAGGGAGAGRTVVHGRLESHLSGVRVPVAGLERQWRRWIRTTHHFVGLAATDTSRLPALRHEIDSAATRSGATVVRLKLWPVSAPPSTELVVATATPPALYLRHHLSELLRAIPRSRFMVLEVVDAHGARILEMSYRAIGVHLTGTLYVRPGLGGCSPIESFGESPPCPVK